MQTLGYSERTGSAPAPSMLERLSWLDKLPIAIIAGLLLGLSAAPYGVWWLAWFSLAPLLLLVFGSRSTGEAALTGLAYGLAYHMVALRWILDLHPMRWFVTNDVMSGLVSFQLWFFESLHQSLLICLFAVFIYVLPVRAGFTPHYKRPFFPVLITVPVIWLFLQWFVATSPIFLGVPIDQIAYGQTKLPALIQIARFGGAQLVEFLILLCNCAIACFLIDLTHISPRFESRSDLLSDRVGSVFDIVFVAALVSFIVQWGQSEVRQSAAMPEYWQNTVPPQVLAKIGDGAKKTGKTAADAVTAQQKANYAPPVPVAVLQGNITPEERKKLTGDDVAKRYLDLAKQLGVGMIVMPSGVLTGESRGREPLYSALPKLAHDERKDIIVGARDVLSTGVAETGNIYTPLSPKADAQLKFRLVPFAEYTPFGSFGSLLSGGMSEKLVGDKPHLTAPYVSTIKSIWGRVGVSLGPELVYPDLIVTQVNRGASLLVNLGDNSYFHTSSLGAELVAAACLRAVENGRYIILSSNNGVSAVIDPHGIVTSSSIAGHKGVLLDRVQFLHRRTPFTRMCLWTPLYR